MQARYIKREWQETINTSYLQWTLSLSSLHTEQGKREMMGMQGRYIKQKWLITQMENSFFPFRM